MKEISREDVDAPDSVRYQQLNRKLTKLKQSQVTHICGQYSALVGSLRDLKGSEKDEKIANFLKNVESNLSAFFMMARMAIGKDEFSKFTDHESVKQRFIKSIRDYFASMPDVESCQKVFGRLMHTVPLPIKPVEQPVEREPLSPLAALKKPIPIRAQPASRLPTQSRLQAPSRMPQATQRQAGQQKGSRVAQPTQRQAVQQSSSRMAQVTSRKAQPTQRQPGQQPQSRMGQPTRVQPQTTLRPPSAPARTQRTASPAQPVPARPTTPRSAEAQRTPANMQRPQSSPGHLNKTKISTPVQGQRQFQPPPNHSPVEKIHEKVTQGLKQLQVMKSREKNATTIKQKLDNLTTRFCASEHRFFGC